MKKISFILLTLISIISFPTYAEIIQVINEAGVAAYANIPTCDGKADTQTILVTQKATWERNCIVEKAIIGWRGDMGEGIWPCVNFQIKPSEFGITTFFVTYGAQPFSLSCKKY